MRESVRRDPGDAFPLAPLLNALLNNWVPYPWSEARDVEGDGPGLRPPRPGRPFGPRDGGSYPSAPPGHTEAPGSNARYSAFRMGTQLFLRAQGTLGNWNQIADIRQAPEKIYPPMFDFLVYSPQIMSPALREFDFTVMTGFPLDAGTVAVRDAQGVHRVAIAGAPAQLRAIAPGAGRAEGFGVGRTIEEAVDAAIAQLPGDDAPDAMHVYRVAETGKVLGGIAGVNYFYARIAASDAPM